jgi:hypothetical protein
MITPVSIRPLVAFALVSALSVAVGLCGASGFWVGVMFSPSEFFSRGSRLRSKWERVSPPAPAMA